MTTRQLTVNLVTERPSDGAFIMVLVEEGPWSVDETEINLRRIQDRLYDCVDAAVDGHFAAKFPDSLNKPVVVRLDCYDTPDKPVRDFIKRFADGIANSKDLQLDLLNQGFVTSIHFEYNWRTLERSADPGAAADCGHRSWFARAWSRSGCCCG
jgi:hypothetical protein